MEDKKRYTNKRSRPLTPNEIRWKEIQERKKIENKGINVEKNTNKEYNKHKYIQQPLSQRKQPFYKTNAGVLLMVIIACCCISVLFFAYMGSLATPDYTPPTDYNDNNDSVDEYGNSVNTNSSDIEDNSEDMEIGYHSADDALSQFDSNNDNSISWSEWVAWCDYDYYTYGFTYTDNARADFIRYDVDGNGYLSRTELAHYFIGPHEYYL